MAGAVGATTSVAGAVVVGAVVVVVAAWAGPDVAEAAVVAVG